MQTVSFSNMEIVIATANDVGSYSLKGDIDDNFDHKRIPILNSTTIRMELSGVKTLNSIGLREWVSFLKSFKATSNIVFFGCSVAIMDQFNQLAISLGRGHVESFYGPYFCESCDIESNRLIITSDILTTLKAPLLSCEKCKKQLEFDALEETYFLFAAGDAA